MKWLVVLLLVLLAPSVFAHEPINGVCIAPERPHDDQDDVLWQRFLADIDAFRACINDLKEFHQASSAQHQADARLAVEAWNEFVHTSLNAPQDFPHNPERHPQQP